MVKRSGVTLGLGSRASVGSGEEGPHSPEGLHPQFEQRCPSS